jgi:hypothetical protein
MDFEERYVCIQEREAFQAEKRVMA